MTDLEYFINEINKDQRKMERRLRKQAARSIPVTLKDIVLDTRDNIVHYLKKKQIDRKLQQDGNESYQQYLAMHKESRIDTLDVFKYDNGYSTVIYTDQGPLILTEEYAKSVDGVTMHSDFASRLGVFDKKQTYEGFCFARDKKGVTQLMYALITNCIYKGAQKDGVEDGGVSIFDGFYRLPNGKFVDLYEEYPVGQKNEMFRELEDMFDAKWQFLHNAGAIVLKGEETKTNLGGNNAPKIGIDGYPEVDESGEDPYLAQGDYPDYDA